uniref:Uncharacterized protein n=1 Tax=Rhizophora mucronata TaxID=61149 RepID=A0A2P2KG45_RHIMU
MLYHRSLSLYCAKENPQRGKLRC